MMLLLHHTSSSSFAVERTSVTSKKLDGDSVEMLLRNGQPNTDTEEEEEIELFNASRRVR